MKVAVMSDSHDNRDNILKVVAIANQEKCDYLLHLGDMVSPFAVLALKGFLGKVIGVTGNCDGEVSGLQKAFDAIQGLVYKPPKTITIQGKRCVLMHEPVLIEELTKNNEVDYIFYGHLHKVDVRQINQTTVINPGESGGWVEKPYFIILDILTGEHETVEL